MKRPAFQFYVRDWLTDPALRSCSLAARGLWADMLAIMHEGTPYGHLAVTGKDGAKDILPPTLARRVGESLPEVAVLLAELEEHGVFARTPAGTIYSRRMVRDERVREVRAAGGVKSLDNPNVPKPKDGAKDTPKDIHSLSGKDSSRPSPAVAVASAVAVVSSSTSAREALPEKHRVDYDDLMRLVPLPVKWEAEIRECLSPDAGKSGHRSVTPEQMGRAIRAYLANDGAKGGISLDHFRTYIRRAAMEKAVSAENETAAEEFCSAIKKAGLHHATTRAQLDEDIATLVKSGDVKDEVGFRSVLPKLDFKLLRSDRTTDAAAVRHIAQQLGRKAA